MRSSNIISSTFSTLSLSHTTEGEGVFAISAATTMSVTSLEFELAMVGVAKASIDLPFLPRQLCHDLVKLVPSLVGIMGAHRR
jgi:hypothetical protein